MGFSYCFAHHLQLPIKTGVVTKQSLNGQMSHQFTLSTRRSLTYQARGEETLFCGYQSFPRFSRSTIRKNNIRPALYNKSSRMISFCLPPSLVASSVFTLGTAAVLPFYTLMVVAPRAKLTRRSVDSNIPYIVLGLLYAYLLCLSWTPDTLRYMFASKYWMPELSGMLKMFSNDMTLASAWIHLLVVDLFAARQVYYDGLQNDIETRHSVSLCLLFCPIGILLHLITKAITRRPTEKSGGQIH
ncbi:hypothetical protein LIER_13746 [Lithospermum erythrorhizon]|uniref:Neoxanthin synthase n=1 Tax=Lithospermum erythrorhizon TaxID=34254 RepID=A0AAV3PZS1_LITER